MNLKDLIKQRRTELGLSQAELARQCGVSRQTISQWEDGVTSPRRARAKRVAAALRLSRGAIDPLAVPSLEKIDISPASLNLSLVKMGDLGNFLSGVSGVGVQKLVSADVDSPADAVAVRVADTSMISASGEGYAVDDIVIVSPSLVPRDNDDVVAIVDGTTILRRYRHRSTSAAGTVFDLVPLAENHATITVNTATNQGVIATVWEHRRRRR